jgi:hypothetical protein
VPSTAGGFPQTPLTEEIETQEVRELLYICEVLNEAHDKVTQGVQEAWDDVTKKHTCTMNHDLLGDPI